MKTKEELLKIAEGIAKETIFVGAEDTGLVWNGLHVFRPILAPRPNGEIPCIGLPQYILLDDEGVERKKDITQEETFEIMDLFGYEDEDEEPEDEE